MSAVRISILIQSLRKYMYIKIGIEKKLKAKRSIPIRITGTEWLDAGE